MYPRTKIKEWHAVESPTLGTEQKNIKYQQSPLRINKNATNNVQSSVHRETPLITILGGRGRESRGWLGFCCSHAQAGMVPSTCKNMSQCLSHMSNKTNVSTHKNNNNNQNAWEWGMENQHHQRQETNCCSRFACRQARVQAAAKAQGVMLHATKQRERRDI